MNSKVNPYYTKKVFANIKCAHCNVEFKPQSSIRRYCSDRCRKRHNMDKFQFQKKCVDCDNFVTTNSKDHCSFCLLDIREEKKKAKYEERKLIIDDLCDEKETYRYDYPRTKCIKWVESMLARERNGCIMVSIEDIFCDLITVYMSIGGKHCAGPAHKQLSKMWDTCKLWYRLVKEN